MIKINSVFKRICQLVRFNPMSAAEINKERNIYNIGSSLLAVIFIFFFIYIDQIPVKYVLTVYSVFTETWFKASIVSSAISFFVLALYYKNFSYILLISVFTLGHFLFVNVYNNQYSLGNNSTKVEVKKEKIRYYSIHWNIG